MNLPIHLHRLRSDHKEHKINTRSTVSFTPGPVLPAITHITMSSFLLNPYDVTPNLTDKDDMKHFQEGYKGLNESNIFDGKKKTHGNTVKLIERFELYQKHEDIEDHN